MARKTQSLFFQVQMQQSTASLVLTVTGDPVWVIPPTPPPPRQLFPPPPHFLHLPSPSPICDTQSQVDPVWIYCPFLDTAFVLTARFLSLLPPHGHLTLNSHLSPAPSFFLVKDTLTSSLLTVADLSAPMNPLALVFSQPAWH